MIGPSGSGKSTYARKLFDDKWIVSSDEIRRLLTGDISSQSFNSDVWPIYNRSAQIRLARYDNVVLDALNIVKWRRVQDMCKYNGIRKVAIVFNNVSLEESIRRVAEDITNGVDRSNVPIKAIEKQHKLFEKGLRGIENEFNHVIYVNE